jgi:hypothetical protein
MSLDSNRAHPEYDSTASPPWEPALCGVFSKAEVTYEFLDAET